MTHPHTQKNDAVPEPAANANRSSDRQQLTNPPPELAAASGLHAPNNVVDAQNAPKSPLSEFDDYVAAERNDGARTAISRDLGFVFEVGDMVWGKVKSHPWWPGRIYNEAFASPAVRRTKKEGHVLVAFFGDSSYGWFEPSELIPFEPNFAEKSRQVSSRIFQKAVEEAVDQASRRCGLGLVCRCRNSANFRPAEVEGYFHVDVPEYEPGVYSSGQIRRARKGFAPREMVAFVRQLGMAPCGGGGDRWSIGFAKNKATVFALRRAVFEQYDETYAQAFGVQPSRPVDQQGNTVDQPVRQAARAPLSGPLVMAETLGDEKNSTKSVKVKDKVKKDEYHFKRRDEPGNSSQLASREETPDAAGHYVFQKRAPDVSVAPQIIEKNEDTGFISQDNAASAVNARVVVEGQIQPDGSGLASQAITLEPEAKPLDNGKESAEQMTRSFEPGNVASRSMRRPDCSGEMVFPSIVDETSQSSHLKSKPTVDVKHDGNVKLSGPHEDFQQTELGFMTVAEGGNDVHQVKCASNVVHTSPVEVKPVKTSVDGVLKKVEGHKRPADDLNSEASATGEKRKKKKKGLHFQPTSGHLEKHSTVGKSVHISGKLIRKPVSIGLAPRVDSHAEPAQVDVSASNLLPVDSTGEVNHELPQLLGDLQALALDPFHGVKRGIPAVVRQCFLQFRSLVYQKSLLLSPPSENEAPEVRVTMSPSSVGASDSPDDHVRASPPVKPVKYIVRPDDPTKAGRKRALSDRQEEITAKRSKKIKDLKALAAEKKAASQKTSEARQGDGKESMVQAPPKIVKPESMVQAPPKIVKPDSTRKVERPSKPVEPTMLVIKFPPKTSLPSVAELKARFARFGPIDQSGLRVFWKTSTCRVVFLHKIDAQAAYKYAVANQSLFGNVGVRYFLRELGDSASEVSEAAKARGDDGANETPRVKDLAAVQVSAQQPLPQPVIQLKSILKKSTGDELGQVAGNGGSSKGTPRVKFMLGGEESSRGDQLAVGNRNNFNDASFADGGAPSPVALDFNSENIQKVNSQPSLPNVPFPTQFKKIPQHNLHNSEMAPRNTPNFFNQSASATATTVDISHQMISLLTRCSDVVTNLTCLLGYVPYHPL